MPLAALEVPAPGTGDSVHLPVAEEEVGIPIPAPGFLQVTERRRKYGGAAWHAPGGPVTLRLWGPGATACPNTPPVWGALSSSSFWLAGPQLYHL